VPQVFLDADSLRHTPEWLPEPGSPAHILPAELERLRDDVRRVRRDLMHRSSAVSSDAS
jgi:hypothetical protein